MKLSVMHLRGILSNLTPSLPSSRTPMSSKTPGGYLRDSESRDKLFGVGS